MNITELEKICSSTCFKFIGNDLIYPTNFNNMKFMIIYPTDGFYLSEKQFTAIFNVIKIYPKNYYISDIEFVDSFNLNGSSNDFGYSHKFYKQFNYNEYKNVDRLFENAIYDMNENWGISIFQDFFAILCGNEKIIKEIKSSYTNSNDLNHFKDFIESTEISNKYFQNNLLELISKVK